MNKKLFVPMALALIASLLFSNVAFAASDASTTRYVGTILSVDAANMTFKIANNKGGSPTIHVDSNTVYRGQASSFADLAASQYVNVTVTKTSGSNVAKIVNVLKAQKIVKITGKITAIDTSAFTILGSDGNTYILQVTAKTAFSGKGVVDFSGLVTGMTVKVTYRDMGNGILRAQTVEVTQLSMTITGHITAIHSSSFTILGVDGVTYTFKVNANTTYSGNGVTSFTELAKGMKVKVTYTELSNGTLRATKVVVRSL
jgi:RecJ-like exonuclease